MRKLIGLMCLAGAVVLFAGCATTAKYEAKLQTMVGVSEDSLYATWGIPSKSMDLKDGSKIVEYRSRSHAQLGGQSYMVPQTTYQTGTATVVGTGSTDQVTYNNTTTTLVEKTEPVQNIHLDCKTTFVINPQGKVASWKWSGNNCIAD